MVQGFSKPPPSATRPPLRLLKPLGFHDFPVNRENAAGAVGAADSGSPRYKKANSAFTPRSRRDTLAVFGLATLVIAALLYIMAARTAQHLDGWHCHPGDRTTTNGRPLCGAPR